MAGRAPGFLVQFFTWWNGTTLGTRFYTSRHGQFVGEDSQGNRYYQTKGGERRWVIYNGLAEPSRIPPGWHGWMHFRTDTPPGDYKAREWERPHLPNQTGSAGAYRPPGSILRPQPETPGDAGYQPWTP